MHQINRLGRTGGHTRAASLTQSRFDVGGSGNVTHAGKVKLHLGYAKGTGTNTGAAAYAFIRADLGYEAAHVTRILGQDGRGPGRRRLGLGNRFIQQFGIVRCSGHIKTFSRKINRPQFDVGFHQPAIQIDPHFKPVGQPLDSLRRHHRHTKHQPVRSQHHLPAQHRFPSPHFQRPSG